ncbi:MAG: GDSL family lipase [Pedobacter sp.]|nr:MAG: GDSL family lipase [Pedobacter sp.]
MNRFFLILTLCSISFCSLAQEQVVKDSTYANGYYVKRMKYFETLPAQKSPIVFLGNSITEVGQWQDVTGVANVVNRGISGDNSYGVFYRLDPILGQKPAKIFLMIGVNDIKRGTPIADIARNYERIVIKVKRESPKTKIYLQSVLPVTESILASIYDNIRNPKIIELNKLMKDLSTKYKVPYVDLYSQMIDERGQLVRSLTTDGLHLQPEAYVIWANYLKKMKYL